MSQCKQQLWQGTSEMETEQKSYGKALESN